MDNRKKIAKETIDILEKGYTTTKRKHEGHEEYENAKKKYALNDLYLYGKWQYVFEKGDLKISLIKLNAMALVNKKQKWFWEIYAHEDKRLFEGTRRFPTKKAVMKAIDNLLGG